MPTTRDVKNDSTIRPRTIPIGTDARGRDYVLKTETPHDTVVIVDDGTRVLRDDLDGFRARHVVETVADEIGWQSCQFRRLSGEKGMPRKYGGRCR